MGVLRVLLILGQLLDTLMLVLEEGKVMGVLVLDQVLMTPITGPHRETVKDGGEERPPPKEYQLHRGNPKKKWMLK